MPVSVKERSRTPEEGVRPIRKMFIANRGEIAVRAAKACERRGIAAVIPYSDLESERNSYATRFVDKNANKGWELAAIEGYSGDETYGDPNAILQEAIIHNCDAIFLGYGFLAENADFVKQVEDHNEARRSRGDEPIRLLAPDSRAMRLLGNKANAREFVNTVKVGLGRNRRTVPIVEGSDKPRTQIEELIRDVEGDGKSKEGIGYPVMVKAPDGGGGMGNIVARTHAELDAAYRDLRGTGEDQGLIVEHYIENAIHVEMQVIADQHGNVVILGERDCTLQRRSQKLVEESPSPHINERQRKKITEESAAIVKKAKYSGPVTIEMIFDKDRVDEDGDMWHGFMEANTRLQVEHVVTEIQTGIDIVDTMIDVAEGRELKFKQKDIKPQGHTMELRVYAEDPDRNFEQQEGILNVLSLPEDVEGVRIDKGYEEGDEVSVEYDGTIFKINIHGVTRADMLERTSQVIAMCEIAGVKNNLAFLDELINTPEFQRGTVKTKFVEEWVDRRRKEARDQIMNELLGENGTFTPFPPSKLRDNFPVNPTFKTSNSAESTTLEESLARQKEKTGLERASEYGIVERDGVRYVLYLLNSKFNAGTFGKEEGWMLTDAIKLAHKYNLPLITDTSTAGVRNTEGSYGIDMMMNSTSDLSEYPPLFHIDIRHGYVLGGVPASYSGRANLFMAVNDDATKIGITGANALAAGEDLHPTDLEGKSSTKAADAYRALNENQEDEGAPVHTPTRHHEERTGADMLPASLTEAGAKISHILQILKFTHPHIRSDLDTHVFSPHEQIGYGHMPHAVTLYDSGEQRPGFVPPTISRLWERFASNRGKEKIIFAPETPEITIGERRRIVKHPDRPTGLDLVDTGSELFDDAVFLDHVTFVDNVHQVLPITSALVRFGDHPILVVTQNRQERINDAGEREIYYKPIRPTDWEATKRHLQWAENVGITVMLMGDTSGADSSRQAEDRGQEIKLAEISQFVQQLKVPVITNQSGLGGSGSVLPFSWYGDYAAMWENATRWPADAPAMRSFIEGVSLLKESDATAEEIAALDLFAAQFIDVTAEAHLAKGRIDKILLEGPGGAHINPRIIVDSNREMLRDVLPKLRQRYLDGTLLEERRRRKEHVALIGSRPNPDYAAQVAELEERL
ncbi:MAG TPA: biotin carboxylase N-terminal domain-containing protein [Candidatus Limnocylindrales bacterium]|nr:biotin carboxylase N-terminal domain-containing protein [Candidatus Limnocylindrales bacterium]